MRRSYGRDFGLSLRMALGLGLVGLIYVVAELICVAITVAGLIDHDWQAAGGGPRKDLRGGLAVQAFCIVWRRSRWRRMELVMDHPPVRKRISRLEELARELGKAAG